jgi:hypothetical protein
MCQCEMRVAPVGISPTPSAGPLLVSAFGNLLAGVNYARPPKQIPRAAAGGEETGRFATRGRQEDPAVGVLRGDRNEPTSLNEGHLASEKR